MQEDKCKRIGRKIEGKVQPLLLVLTNIDSAREVLQNAKRLHGHDRWKNIFVNPYLTPSESRAAYEERQRRRVKKAELRIEDG